MARTKSRNRPPSPARLVTLTRFFLPLEHEWPTWEREQADDPHYPPLGNVKGYLYCQWMGRLIDDPEQAVFIIEWDLLDSFKNFLSSSVCAEFLTYLPESREAAAASLPTATQMEQLSLDARSAPSSRFLVAEYMRPGIGTLEGVVTLTTFSITAQVGTNIFAQEFQLLKERYNGNMEDGPEVSFSHRHPWPSRQWFHVVEEDNWIKAKFGPQHTADASSFRALFCNAALWSRVYEEPLLQEKATFEAEDAKANREEAIAEAMPPATAYIQERWDIRELPYPQDETETEDATE